MKLLTDSDQLERKLKRKRTISDQALFGCIHTELAKDKNENRV